MSGTDSKIRNFGKAIKRLKEAVEYWHQHGEVEVVRDGVIQRFELTYELAWKAAKEMLAQSGTMDVNSPKAVMREAYAQRMIVDEAIWLQMISDRNLTSHVYKEELADEIAVRISKQYIPVFEQLYLRLIKE